MDTTNIEKFDPTIEALTLMVKESGAITEKSEPLEIRRVRLDLKNARIAITKRGKKLRKEAVAYQRAIIAKKKELVAIIEPEEDRLERIEEVARVRKEAEDRVNLLPMRRDRLAELGITATITDDFLCMLDTVGFQEWTNNAVAIMNEARRIELEAKERAVKEAEERIAREKEMKKREEKAREDEKRLAEEYIKQAEADAERRVKEAEEKAKRDAEEVEKKRLAAIEAEKMKAAAETAKREADEKYRKWLSDNGATPDVTGWIAIQDPYGKNEMVLYKEVSRYVL